MKVIDTPYHLTFSDEITMPDFACEAKCKKVWWDVDFDGRDKSVCPLCSGELTRPTIGVHFIILDSANRKLKFSDFKKVTQIPNKEKKSLKKYLEAGVHISNMSLVKPAFVGKAKSEWCS
jgi:hypothetical protein